ncbi:MAG TPA: APC family permease [Longimicrobiaceae bacterium]|jgi:amino acid transporter|nr:APC family permease [Longimicrobiaceae bacterium]
MGIRQILFGRRLRSDEQERQKIGPLAGIPVLGLDALASAAYGPEAALTVLLPLGAAASGHIAPISAVILVVLGLVFVSYRQTIPAYPQGGGSYTVASENLGMHAGLLAASALTIDYVLNVAVAISAGVGAIVSAIPVLLPYTLPLCLCILALLTLVNLRGVREAGLLFMVPTYLFVASLGVAIAWGVAKAFAAGGHPVPLARPAHPHAATAAAGAASLWLLLRAFSSGCTALTGVEAVSNGVPLFREPRAKNARRTLAGICGILALLLTGIAYLCHAYGITATTPAAAGYESVLSQLVAAVAGRGTFYYIALASVVTVLALSANTSFADFPRLCRVLAIDGFLPAGFSYLGRRLVYSRGIVLLSLLAAGLLTVFGGITDRLIPLFAVGAFLAFTLSQAGMVMHWRREGGPHARHSLVLNGAGALATGATLVVVAVSKFEEGAWITVLLLPALVLLFKSVRAFHDHVDRQTEEEGPLDIESGPPPIVVVPLKRLDRVARKALGFAVTISHEVLAVHMLTNEHGVEKLSERWAEWIECPLREAGLPVPRLVEVPSSYREVTGPLLDYVRQLARSNEGRYVAVIIPETVERKWYHLLLHSHRATVLKGLLFLRGGPQVIVINTPWYLTRT